MAMNEPTTDLVRDAVQQARELARLEVTLAKNEAIDDIKAMRTSAIAFGAGAAMGVDALALLLVALALALDGAVAALVIGVLLAAGAGGAAAYGLSHLPKNVLDRTKKRLEEDVHRLKERTA